MHDALTGPALLEMNDGTRRYFDNFAIVARVRGAARDEIAQLVTGDT